MDLQYFSEKTFGNLYTAKKPLVRGEYENCVFEKCDLAEADLSEFRFVECEFKSCNLSLAKLGKTALREVSFFACKMLGLRFEDCHDFGFAISFDGCNLAHSTFVEMKLKNMVFKDSQLQETDFSGADLSGSVFDKCDLQRAIFQQTNLKKADLRTAANYAIDPENNRIRDARFSFPAAAALLDKYEIRID